MRNYNGGITLTNKTGPEAASLDINSGQVVVDSTVTNGQITIRGIGKLTNNSAGAAVVDDLDFVEGIKIQILSYNGSVHVDPILGSTGTKIGTNGINRNPCSTIADAITIANAINLRRLSVYHTLTLSTDTNDIIFDGFGQARINVDGYLVNSCVFRDMTITGIIGHTPGDPDTHPTFESCYLEEVTNLGGIARNCILDGYNVIHENETMLFTNLRTEERATREIGVSVPTTLSVNGGEVAIQGLDGYLVITDINTPTSLAVISMNAGHVFIDPSCNDGTIIIRGNGQVTNGGSANLNTSGSLTVSDISSDTFKKLFPFVT